MDNINFCIIFVLFCIIFIFPCACSHIYTFLLLFKI